MDSSFFNTTFKCDRDFVIERLKMKEDMLNYKISELKEYSKRNVSLIMFTLVVLVFDLIVASIKKQIEPIDIFNISLITCISYKVIVDFSSSRFELKWEIEELRSEIEILKSDLEIL